MIAADPVTPLSAKAIERLQHLRGMINTGSSFKAIWDELLTEDERAQLGGDIVRAVDGRSPVGCWMYLRGVNDAQAIYELADRLDMLRNRDRYWLAREIEALPDSQPSARTPKWHRDSGELWLGGLMIRNVRIAKSPSGVQRILNAFEDAEWPSRIDSPFDEGREPQAIHQYVKELNKKLKFIRFGVQGSGKLIIWTRRQTSEGAVHNSQ